MAFANFTDKAAASTKITKKEFWSICEIESATEVAINACFVFETHLNVFPFRMVIDYAIIKNDYIL